MNRDEIRIRAGLAVTALGLLVAVVSGLTSPLRTVGGLTVLIGWALSAYGLHRYGRAG